jgi:hypothetical protein
VANPDGISSKSSFVVKIMAAWHGLEPTQFFANGGSHITIYGACLPTLMMTVMFAGSFYLFFYVI